MARYIYHRFLFHGSSERIWIQSEVHQRIASTLSVKAGDDAGFTPPTLFVDAQEWVLQLMAIDVMPRFLTSKSRWGIEGAVRNLHDNLVLSTRMLDIYLDEDLEVANEDETITQLLSPPDPGLLEYIAQHANQLDGFDDFAFELEEHGAHVGADDDDEGDEDPEDANVDDHDDGAR
eukprot:TRINITY_DN50612_c0_g1_i1.p1 TRINITY_DN50612_c0_g1~~TRINITY_DN50612_c0_g1_i1.p1  ORF type:complete len:206 (-),score=106.28 TRINITY_DN50612_c0_g1_i1:372-899(-)